MESGLVHYLIQEQPQLFWGVIGSMYIGNVMLLALNLPLISLWVRLLTIPYRYLAVLVVVICSVGAYSVTSNILDVGIMVIFGVFGYLMRKGGFPAVPLVLAMILGRILELSVQQSLIMSGGDILHFYPETYIGRPVVGSRIRLNHTNVTISAEEKDGSPKNHEEFHMHLPSPPLPLPAGRQGERGRARDNIWKQILKLDTKS